MKKTDVFDSSFGAFSRQILPADTVHELFGKAGFNKNGANITETDLFNIPSSVSADEFLERIKKTLGEDYLAEFSSLWKEACRIYEHERGLHQSLPVKIPRDFHTDEELFALLRSVRPLQGGHSSFLGPVHCALLKITAAVYDYKSKNLMTLKKETDYFDTMMRGFPGITYNDDSQIHTAQCTDYETENPVTVDFKYFSRAKNMFSCVLKMIRIPEWNSAELLRDPIACTFDLLFPSNVGEQEKMRITRALTYYIISQLQLRGITEVAVDNQGLLSSASMKILFKECALNKKIEVQDQSHQNPHSVRAYRDLKINGKIGIPENGQKGNLIKQRLFEVKFYWHEIGDVGREPYKARQLLEEQTRLFGYISEDDIHTMIHSLLHHKGETRTEKMIRQEEFDPYLIPVGEQKGEKFYMTKEQFTRLEQADILPAAVGAFRTRMKQLFKKKK